MKQVPVPGSKEYLAEKKAQTTAFIPVIPPPVRGMPQIVDRKLVESRIRSTVLDENCHHKSATSNHSQTTADHHNDMPAKRPQARSTRTTPQRPQSRPVRRLSIPEYTPNLSFYEKVLPCERPAKAMPTIQGLHPSHKNFNCNHFERVYKFNFYTPYFRLPKVSERDLGKWIVRLPTKLCHDSSFIGFSDMTWTELISKRGTELVVRCHDVWHGTSQLYNTSERNTYWVTVESVVGIDPDERSCDKTSWPKVDTVETKDK